MTMRLRFLMSALAVVAFADGAQAADIAQGETLARALCSNCHIVGPGEAGGVVSPDVPSFMAVAAIPGQSVEKVKAFILSPPHPAMPKVQLTKRELEAVAAYIMSLKPKN